jgi:hypothetical protein
MIKMIQDDDEIRFNNIINLLKHIPKVSSPPGFEANLMRKINSGNFPEPQKTKWFDWILAPSHLIPSAVAALAVLALIFVMNINSVDPENPFLVVPKMRENVNMGKTGRITFRTDNKSMASEINAASINNSFGIDKEGLNFLQIRLNDAEKAKINNLREQIRTYLKQNLSTPK